MVIWCQKDLVLSAGIGGRTRKVEVVAGDCASEAREFGALSVQDCKDVL